MIDVTENKDGTFTISWDENDPQESILNDYSEEDFKAIIANYCELQVKINEYATHKTAQNSIDTREQSQSSGISEATQKDYEDFWEEK